MENALYIFYALLGDLLVYYYMVLVIYELKSVVFSRTAVACVCHSSTTIAEERGFIGASVFYRIHFRSPSPLLI